MDAMISSTDAVRNFSDCLVRVGRTGQALTICRNGKPVAMLAPLPDRPRGTMRDFVNAWRPVADPDFADDLEKVNRADEVARNPWDS